MKEFNIGDYVKILDNGSTFSTYQQFVELYFNEEQKKKWEHGYSPSVGSVGKVFVKEQHIDNPALYGQLYGIELENGKTVIMRNYNQPKCLISYEKLKIIDMVLNGVP